ncbi:MAG: fumarylacetoacetate hydrolase family protein [Candidatus Binataceae bacterium]
MANDVQFSLGTFAGKGAPYAAIVLGDMAVDLNHALRRITPGAPQATIRSMLEDWDASFPLLRDVANRAASDGLESPGWSGAAAKIDSLRILPPVQPPGTIFQSGANYRKHVIQLSVAHRYGAKEGDSEEEVYARAARMMDERARTGAPFIFAGIANAMCGAHDDIVLPARGAQHDWELELAVIFGKTARHVPRDRALDYVAGYAICNDITTRDLIFRKDVMQLGADWIGSKNAPTFKPTGPYIVPRAFAPDPMNLRILLKLNGQTMQNESTSDMLFDVARLIEYTSDLTVIRPGDMLLTGSPAGNGSHYNRFLQPGDVIEAEITGLGMQRNRCVAETR